MNNLFPVPPPGYSAEFERFWIRYPRKAGTSKLTAHKMWLRAMKDATYGEIMAGLDAYPFSPEAHFQPHAATWLSQRRWVIEADTPPVSKTIDRKSKTGWMEGYKNPGHFIDMEIDGG